MNENRLLSLDQSLMAIDVRLELRRMRQVIGQVLLGKAQTSLLTLDHYRGNRAITRQHKAGIYAIPVRQIKGSVNAAADYDADFYPQYGTREGWTQQCLKCLNGAATAAIQVVQVHDVYFVEVGHLDASIARVLGQGYIDAYVTEIELEAEPVGRSDAVLDYQAADSYETARELIRES